MAKKALPGKSTAKAPKKTAAKDGGKVSVPTPTKPGKASSLIDTRVIYCGDNLEQLQKLPEACIDLIYIDPPFNSNRNYEVFWGETKEKRSFEDRHANTQAYIDYMRPRCAELARVLKKTGSFYYHCDWHASHYVKVMLDQIMGENNFQNEIVWKRYGSHNDVGQGSKHYGRSHDVMLFYSGGDDDYTWHQLFMPLDPDYVAETYGKIDEETGKPYATTPLTGPGGEAKGNPVYEWNGHTRAWRVSKATMQKLHDDGELYYSKTGYVRRKLFLDESRGVPVQSLWTDIKALTGSHAERLGYPTQKPLALLDRIIQASSNPNDIVLDAFCGCGTALVAAQNLGRQWIGIDISPTACRVMAKRLRDVCGMKESEPGHRAHDVRSFIVRDLPWSVAKLREIPPFEFENWAVIALGGIPNKVQVGDMGIDGRIFPVGTKPAEAATKGKKGHTDAMFADDWFPIQVKQSDKVGRPDVDAFAHAMHRDERQRGFMVAFSFSSDAFAECARIHKKDGVIIKLLTVQEILDEEHVQKM